MKKNVLLASLILLSAHTAGAQQAAGVISIYMDVQGSDCGLVAGGVPTNTWNLVHVLTTGATAIQFQATMPACATGIMFLSDQAQFPVTVGDSQTGVAIGYGVCLTGPIHVLSIVSFGSTANTCCNYPITGDPDTPSGTVEVVDCAGNLLTNVPSQAGMINSTAGCLCGNPPVEASTWGRVKSLYSD